MGISKFIGIGAAVVVAIMYGLFAWRGQALDTVTAERDAAKTARACVAATSEDVNKSHVQQIKALTASIAAQTATITELQRKERKAAANLAALQRKIANVPQSQNVPVSDHIEFLLDELRRPVPGPSGQPAGGVDKGDAGSPADPDRPAVPAETNPGP